MHRLILPGRIIFGIGVTALGILQFFVKDFIIARPPAAAWAADIPGKTAWAYASGLIIALCGLAIIFNIKARTAALLFALITFIASFVSRNIPDMVGVKTSVDLLWKVNAYKALAFCGGALVVAASVYKQDRVNSNSLITVGSILFALFLIICGIAHFKFDDFVQSLIPDYIGNKYFWTYVAAVGLLAGGVGLFIRQTRKWAAAVSGLMILCWFFLFHIPRAVNIPPLTSVPVYSEWMGVFESFAFCGVLFVLAGLASKRSE